MSMNADGSLNVDYPTFKAVRKFQGGRTPSPERAATPHRVTRAEMDEYQHQVATDDAKAPLSVAKQVLVSMYFGTIELKDGMMGYLVNLMGEPDLSLETYVPEAPEAPAPVNLRGAKLHLRSMLHTGPRPPGAPPTEEEDPVSPRFRGLGVPKPVPPPSRPPPPVKAYVPGTPLGAGFPFGYNRNSEAVPKPPQAVSSSGTIRLRPRPPRSDVPAVGEEEKAQEPVSEEGATVQREPVVAEEGETKGGDATPISVAYAPFIKLFRTGVPIDALKSKIRAVGLNPAATDYFNDASKTVSDLDRLPKEGAKTVNRWAYIDVKPVERASEVWMPGDKLNDKSTEFIDSFVTKTTKEPPIVEIIKKTNTKPSSVIEDRTKLETIEMAFKVIKNTGKDTDKIIDALADMDGETASFVDQRIVNALMSIHLSDLETSKLVMLDSAAPHHPADAFLSKLVATCPDFEIRVQALNLEQRFEEDFILVPNILNAFQTMTKTVGTNKDFKCLLVIVRNLINRVNDNYNGRSGIDGFQFVSIDDFTKMSMPKSNVRLLKALVKMIMNDVSVYTESVLCVDKVMLPVLSMHTSVPKLSEVGHLIRDMRTKCETYATVLGPTTTALRLARIDVLEEQLKLNTNEFKAMMETYAQSTDVQPSAVFKALYDFFVAYNATRLECEKEATKLGGIKRGGGIENEEDLILSSLKRTSGFVDRMMQTVNDVCE